MKTPLAKKKWAQHYLHDQKTVEMICSDFARQAEAIIEVGPGAGILTKRLAALSLPLLVVEKDRRFKEHLRTLLPDEKILWADALDVDWASLISRLTRPTLGRNGKVWLVSNLPYNISTVLFIKFLQVSAIEMMTLMFQREVGEKIVRLGPETKAMAMGSLMALGQTYFECRILAKVPPTAFSPPPKVDSLVVSFSRRKCPSVPLEKFSSFEAFLRQLFSQRRKQVVNVLKRHHPKEKKEKLEAILEKLKIDLAQRAETFDLGQVQQLYFKLWA